MIIKHELHSVPPPPTDTHGFIISTPFQPVPVSMSLVEENKSEDETTKSEEEHEKWIHSIDPFPSSPHSVGIHED